MTFKEILELMDTEVSKKLEHINITWGFIGTDHSGSNCKFWMELKGDEERGIVGKVVENTISFPIEKKWDFLRLVQTCASKLIMMHILPHPRENENTKILGDI